MSTKITTREIKISEYPFLLQQIPKLHPSMHIAGILPSDGNKFLCVIGARRYSNYGLEVCRKLIGGLSGYPIVIVSGLAIGIDSIAHECALKAGLNTIAFPGSGLHYHAIYPSAHRELAHRIVAKGGALLSPFDLDQEGADWTFPTRNRLMAGASHATIIIEAKRGSGTLITADYATEFGRDILAVPGSIFSELSYGPHMLIERGATPITSSEDILRALGLAPASEKGEGPATLPASVEVSLSPEEKVVVNELRMVAMTSSELVEKIGVSPTVCNILLSELELRGIVRENEGVYRV